MDIDPALLAAADRERQNFDRALDGLIGTARQRIADTGDPTIAFAAQLASLMNSGASKGDAGLIAAAAVRLAQVTVE